MKRLMNYGTSKKKMFEGNNKHSLLIVEKTRDLRSADEN